MKYTNQKSVTHLLTRIKHLRGRHDQLDHAWNRGMGQGGYGAGLAPNQMGPLPTENFYRKRLTDLTEQRRRGEITRAEMRRQMRDLRGITTEVTPTLTLANTTKRPDKKVKIGPTSYLAPNPIDVSEFKPGGIVYNIITNAFGDKSAENLKYEAAYADIAKVINTSDLTPFFGLFSDLSTQIVYQTLQSSEYADKVDNFERLVEEEFKNRETMRDDLNQRINELGKKGNYYTPNVDDDLFKMTIGFRDAITQLFMTSYDDFTIEDDFFPKRYDYVDFEKIVSNFYDYMQWEMDTAKKVINQNPTKDDDELYTILISDYNEIRKSRKKEFVNASLKALGLKDLDQQPEYTRDTKEQNVIDLLKHAVYAEILNRYDSGYTYSLLNSFLNNKSFQYFFDKIRETNLETDFSYDKFLFNEALGLKYRFDQMIDKDDLFRSIVKPKPWMESSSLEKKLGITRNSFESMFDDRNIEKLPEKLKDAYYDLSFALHDLLMLHSAINENSYTDQSANFYQGNINILNNNFFGDRYQKIEKDLLENPYETTMQLVNNLLNAADDAIKYLNIQSKSSDRLDTAGRIIDDSTIYRDIIKPGIEEIFSNMVNSNINFGVQNYYAKSVDDLYTRATNVGDLNKDFLDDESYIPGIIKSVLTTWAVDDENFSNNQVTSKVLNVLLNQYGRSKMLSGKQLFLSILYDLQNYNEKPTVLPVSDILNPKSDVLTDVDGNPLTFYRAVSGAQYIDEMRNGDKHWPGRGVSGYGTYTKTQNLFNSHVKESVLPDADFPINTQFGVNKKDFLSQQKKVFENKILPVLNDISALFDSLKNDIDKSDLDDFKKDIISREIFEGKNNADDLSRIISALAKGQGPVDLNISGNYEFAKRVLDKGLIDNSFLYGIKNVYIKEIVAASNSIASMTSMNADTQATLQKELYALYSHLDSLVYEPYSSRKDVQKAIMQNIGNSYGADITVYTVNADARVPPFFVNQKHTGPSGYSEALTFDDLIRKEFYNRYSDFFDDHSQGDYFNGVDLGIMMTMLGWDMYFAHPGSYSTNAVILNRGILNIADKEVNSSSEFDELSE